MSLIRALSKELQARSDESLRALFSARPDLISPGVPDFAALAARASGRVSVQRALERLNRPQMQVLETLHLCTNSDTGHSASAAMLKKLISGSSAAAIDRLLHSLQELALVHRADPPHGAAPAAAKQRHYLPVGSLKDVIGIYPAGLGRSYTELVRLQPAFAQRVVQLVAELHRSGAAVAPATTPMEAALSLQHIRPVDPGRRDAHEHLAGPGLRGVDVGEDEGVGPSELRDGDCLHGLTVCRARLGRAQRPTPRFGPLAWQPA